MRLIDANEAKNNVNKLIIGASDFAKDTRESCYNAIDEAATVDSVEVVHGKWTIPEYEYLLCSSCANYHYTGFDSMAEAKQNLMDGESPNYCSNCGAKMDL